MPLNLTLLYRGPLSSCNYDCSYCPFAKRHETAAQLAVDRRALERFLGWIDSRGPNDRLAVFFTPWGEALIRRWYQQALVQLTHRPHVRKAAIQTNLSCPLDWLDDCRPERLGLWCTWHPSQTPRAAFLARCRELDRRGIRYSVGAVGLREHFDEFRALRTELAPGVYFWINAYKRQPDYYSDADLAALEAIDPLFRTNTRHHASDGRSCRCGTSVVSVDGDGTLYRCHFVRQPIGNLYDADFEQALYDRPCPNATCGCHIGYVHLDHLNLYPVYGDGLLERIAEPPIISSSRRNATAHT